MDKDTELPQDSSPQSQGSRAQARDDIEHYVEAGKATALAFLESLISLQNDQILIYSLNDRSEYINSQLSRRYQHYSKHLEKYVESFFKLPTYQMIFGKLFSPYEATLLDLCQYFSLSFYQAQHSRLTAQQRAKIQQSTLEALPNSFYPDEFISLPLADLVDANFPGSADVTVQEDFDPDDFFPEEDFSHAHSQTKAKNKTDGSELGQELEQDFEWFDQAEEQEQYFRNNTDSNTTNPAPQQAPKTTVKPAEIDEEVAEKEVESQPKIRQRRMVKRQEEISPATQIVLSLFTFALIFSLLIGFGFYFL